MLPSLFINLREEEEPLWIVKEFFNSINNSLFPEIVNDLSKEIGHFNEYIECHFPHEIDYDEEPFTGVKVRFLDHEVIVSNEIFKKCLLEACHSYLKLHPESHDDLINVFQNDRPSCSQ